MDYKNKVAELIKTHIELDIETIASLIEIPPNSEMGDYAFPCFKLSKVMKKAPNIIAEELKNNISSEEFEKIENIGAYLNFYVDKVRFAENTINKILEEEDNYGASNIGQGKTVCVEYSSPNIAKHFHAGHLFSTVIGNSLCKMYKKEGYTVIELNNLGDWNMQFGKLNGDEFYNGKMDVVVRELKEKGLLVESNGVQVVSLKDYNMPPCIVKGDGALIYSAMDLAAAMYRRKAYDFYKCVYAANLQQALHFKQIFKVLELAGHEWAKDCVHVGFGLVKFADRKFFSKSGAIALADDLFREAIEKAMEVIKDKEEIRNKEEAAKKIGVGAVIFTYLKNSREKDIVFDWKKILSFEGETALYVQYAYARSNSILAKTGKCAEAIDYSKLSSKEEFELVKSLANFNNVITLALDKLEPSILTRYVIEVAKGVDKCYNACLILSPEDEDIKAVKLCLIKASLQVIKNGLELLGIDIVEKIYTL